MLISIRRCPSRYRDHSDRKVLPCFYSHQSRCRSIASNHRWSARSGIPVTQRSRVANFSRREPLAFHLPGTIPPGTGRRTAILDDWREPGSTSETDRRTNTPQKLRLQNSTQCARSASSPSEMDRSDLPERQADSTQTRLEGATLRAQQQRWTAITAGSKRFLPALHNKS